MTYNFSQSYFIFFVTCNMIIYWKPFQISQHLRILKIIFVSQSLILIPPNKTIFWTYKNGRERLMLNDLQTCLHQVRRTTYFTTSLYAIVRCFHDKTDSPKMNPEQFLASIYSIYPTRWVLVSSMAILQTMSYTEVQKLR